MLNLQNLNPHLIETNDGYSNIDKNVINSMYNILKDDGINVKWNSDGTITLFRPAGLSSISKIKFREFIGELLPITTKELPKLKARIGTCYNALNSGYMLSLSNPFNNLINFTPLADILNISHDWQYSEDEDSQVLYNLRLIIEEANRKLQKLFYPIADTITVNSDLVTALGNKEIVYDKNKIILPSGWCSNVAEYYEGGTLRFPKLVGDQIQYDQIIEHSIPTGTLRKVDYNRIGDTGAMLYLESVDETSNYRSIDHNIRIYYEVDYSQAWSYYTQFTYEINKTQPLCDIYKTLRCVSHQTFRLNNSIINSTLCVYFDQDYYSMIIVNPYGKKLNTYIRGLFSPSNPLYPYVGDVQVTRNNMPYLLSVGQSIKEDEKILSIAFMIQRDLQEADPAFVIYRVYIDITEYLATFQSPETVDGEIYNYDFGVFQKSNILAKQPNFYNLLDMVNGSVGEIPGNTVKSDTSPSLQIPTNLIINGFVILNAYFPQGFNHRLIADFCIFPNITITDNNNVYSLFNCVNGSGSKGLHVVDRAERLPYQTYGEIDAILNNGGYVPGYEPDLRDVYSIQLFVDSFVCGYSIPYYLITFTALYYETNYLGLREAYVFGYDEALYIPNSTLNNFKLLNGTEWTGAYLTINNNPTVNNRDFIICQELGITEDGKIEGLVKMPVLHLEKVTNEEEDNEEKMTIPLTLHIYTEPNTMNIYTNDYTFSGFEKYTFSNVNASLTYDGLTNDIIKQLETELLFKFEYNDIELTVNGFPNGDGIVYHLNDISRIDFKEYQTDNTATSINIKLSQNGERVEPNVLSEYFGKLYISIDWEQ